MKYQEHFLMDINTVCDYVKEKLDFFSENEEVRAEEIGDGNINYVFRIYSDDKSIVVKQADKLLRSSQRPLDLYRNKIESEILKLQGEIIPGFVPVVYYYDENMASVIMEDISEFKSLRKEFMQGKIFKNFADEISTFLAKSMLPTTDLVMNVADKKRNVKKYTNIELCAISETLVFTEPYYDYKKQNSVIQEQLEFVENNIYNNEILKMKVALLRNKFMNETQSLIHGDVHSGSIFVNENGTKIIDPEFAFYGPMGYDVGNVIGNLFFSLAYAKYNNENASEFIEYLNKTIIDTINLFIEKFSLEYDKLVEFELYKSKLFKNEYINSVIKDSFGYAGTEIIRRVVGASKVAEMHATTDTKAKIPMERSLLELAIQFITKSDEFKTGEDAINAYYKLVN